MSAYTISRNGEQFGPYSDAEMHAHINSGHIQPNDLTWKEGMASWLPVSQIFSAGADAGPAVAPPPYAWQARPTVSPASVPIPPGLHWGLVLLFSVITLGIFGWVWFFIQNNWINKIAPETQSTRTMCAVGYIGFTIVGQFMSASHPVLGFVLLISGWGTAVAWALNSGKAMQHYYNSIEPIGLRISTPMLVFFAVIYLQYHMHRIATWKKTGYLAQQ